MGSPTTLSADAIIDIIGGRQGNNVTVLAADEASFIVPEFCEFSHSTGTNSTEAIEWSRSRLDEDTAPLVDVAQFDDRHQFDDRGHAEGRSTLPQAI